MSIVVLLSHVWCPSGYRLRTAGPIGFSSRPRACRCQGPRRPWPVAGAVARRPGGTARTPPGGTARPGSGLVPEPAQVGQGRAVLALGAALLVGAAHGAEVAVVAGAGPRTGSRTGRGGQETA